MSVLGGIARFVEKSLGSFIGKLDLLFERCRWSLIYNRYRLKYDIDDGFRFNGIGTMFYGDGEIHCGANSYIGRYSSIASVSGFSVSIGENVAISHFVKIYTRNSDPNQDFSKKGTPDFLYDQGDVSIGDNCWLGASVFVKQGVVIGENAVVGANSVVVDDIPPYAVAAGSPAKVLYYKDCRPADYE